MANWIEQDGNIYEIMIGRMCSFCGEPIQRPNGIVQWIGTNTPGAMLLHCVCAEKLGSQIIRDAGRCDARMGLHPSMWEKTPTEIKEGR